jgi:hypothetical protein
MRTRHPASSTSQIVNIRLEQSTLDREAKLRKTLKAGNRSDTLRRCIEEGMKALERQSSRKKRKKAKEAKKTVAVVASAY